MRYDIKLRLAHQYTQPAGNGRHIARVLPRVIPGRQTVLTHFTDISPLPSERLEGIDFFGNPTTTLVHKNAHDEMLVKLACRVDVMAQSEWLDFLVICTAFGGSGKPIKGWKPTLRCIFWGRRPD